MDPSIEEPPVNPNNGGHRKPENNGSHHDHEHGCNSCSGGNHVETRYIHHIIYQQAAQAPPQTNGNGSGSPYTPIEEMFPFIANQLAPAKNNQGPSNSQFGMRRAYDPHRHNDESQSSETAKEEDSASAKAKEDKTLFFKLPNWKNKNSAPAAASNLRKKAVSAKPLPAQNDDNADEDNADLRSKQEESTVSSNKRSPVANQDDDAGTKEKDEAEDEHESDASQSAHADSWNEEINIPKPKRIWSGIQGVAVSTFGMFLPAFVFFASMASAPKRLTLVLLHHPVEASIELLLVASVPFINYFVWNALCKGKTNVSRFMVMALGAAFTTSLAIAGMSFAGLFAGSQELMAAIGTDFSVGFMWLGVLSLLCAAVSGFLINKLILCWELPGSRFKVVSQAISGILLSLIAFAGSEYRPWCIRMAQSEAVSVDEKKRAAGLAWLRQLKPEREILMECADQRAAGLPGLFYPIRQSTQHQLYFTLTGTPYSFRDENAKDLSDMPDDYLRRHVVGDRVDNLVLTRSSLTGALHPNTLSSTLNWTFVVKNGSSTPQEARAEIGLPPGAAITGLTMWHRGESEDADFVASNKVEDAQMTVAGSNTPAMVTDLGHGRALLHAYPVPPEEELKIRVTMVVPMKADSDSAASMITPQLIATNFGLSGDHLIRLRSETELSSSSKNLTKGSSPTGEKVISGQLDEKQLETNGITVFANRAENDKPYAVMDKISTRIHEQDRKEKEARIRARLKAAEQQKDDNKLKEVVVMIDGSRGVSAQIEQLSKVLSPSKKKNVIAPKAKIRTIQSHYLVEGINKVGAAAPKHLVVVIDGSEKMSKHIKQIESALRAIPSSVPTSVIIANQEDTSLAKPTLLAKRLEDLKNVKFVGGQDNLKAVVDGAELAGESNGGALLWIHGPQPVINEEIYIMSPYTATPSFYELSLDAGTDTFEFFKNHTEIGPFTQVPRDHADIDADLSDFFKKWKPGANSYAVQLADKTATPKDFLKPSAEEAKELLTMHAVQECNKLIANRHFRKAARLALSYGFVSPVSSAIVSGQPKQEANDADDQQMQDASNAANQQQTQDASNAADQQLQEAISADSSSGVDNDPQAPTLQGATNGTIGAQSADATIIQGVNTAGTVRVNNLANLEALLNIIANLAEVLALLGGLAFAINGLMSKAVLKLGEDIELGRGGKIVLGIIIATSGLMIPGVINWFVASARDANLFS